MDFAIWPGLPSDRVGNARSVRKYVSTRDVLSAKDARPSYVARAKPGTTSGSASTSFSFSLAAAASRCLFHIAA
jgi:hypothetical protein